VALCKYPAIEKNFLYFSDGKTNLTFSKADAELRVITGPAIIPDKEIYRFDENTNEEYWVWFSKDTVRALAEKFMIEMKLDRVNIEHDSAVSDVSLVEAWLVEDPSNDKANALGFFVPKGTLMVSYKVNDDATLAKIRGGEVRGFSIEGAFVQAMSGFSSGVSKADAARVDYVMRQLAK
jgi:hypothetical protein